VLLRADWLAQLAEYAAVLKRVPAQAARKIEARNIDVRNIDARKIETRKNKDRGVKHLTQLLQQFQAHGGDAEIAQRFLDFSRSSPAVYERTHWPGHFTASVWLLDASETRVLLTQHRKLQRWLQLGGHADGDSDLCAVALKEAYEESGLQDLVILPEIFDLDVHPIPARGADPEHAHWDVRFVVRATGSDRYRVSAESLDLAWVAVRDIASNSAGSFDASLVRMAQRWLRSSAAYAPPR
jgi:8-oxo-dGTP pyrophosphatase MutT (NUDIX family)